ncbi:hypothetical protein [Brevibacillus borstelensis]|uniref:hypothetical protein n=1 Tax=Brevibacillus borstelensis TaxID=45462 RepID=UPI0030C2C6D6
MELFKEDGEVKGYYPPGHGFIMDGYSMFFAYKNLMLLQLNIADSALASEDCGVSRSNAYQWLWETGKELIERGEVKTAETVTILSYDVKNGQLITPYCRLRRDPSLRH